MTDTINSLNINYSKLEEDYNILNNTNITLQKNNDDINQLYKDIKIKYDELIKRNKEEKEKLMDEEFKDILSENNNKLISSKGIIGKLKHDLFLSNQKNLELNKIIEQNKLTINNLEQKINQKDFELTNIKKITEDLKRLKNLEHQLKLPEKQNDVENVGETKLEEGNNKIKENENKNNSIKMKNEEINTKENDKDILKLQEKIKKLEIENQKEISNNISLNERNINLEKEVIKANEELDLYEVELKEADIEIKSLKIKISELLEEIKRCKHIQTIEEAIDESNETDEKEEDTEKIKDKDGDNINKDKNENKKENSDIKDEKEKLN